MSWDIEGFKSKLKDQHVFPGRYQFKFIVPSNKIEEVKALTQNGEISLKPSSKGKYTSVNIGYRAQSADEIIEIYQQASKIEGCIAL